MGESFRIQQPATVTEIEDVAAKEAVQAIVTQQQSSGQAQYQYFGEDSPEGAQLAPLGSTFQDTKNGKLYVKESGGTVAGDQTSTGWVQK